MKTISAAVGRYGQNRASDVRVVQDLLNRQRIPGAIFPLKVDGISGSLTVRRIESFQRSVVHVLRPDGRIDPGGKTLEYLNKTSLREKLFTVASASSVATNLLKAIENLRLKPYDDQSGKDITQWVTGATIGYGHLIRQNEWNLYQGGITLDQADKLFDSDLQPFVNAINSMVKVSLTQNQFDALAILAFNIGVSALSRSSVLKLVNDPSAKTGYSDLESAWKANNKTQKKVSQGLINRRNAEWNIYSRNVYKRW